MLTEYSKLEKHLGEDLFGSDFSGDTLYIVDDYNIDCNMSDETINNFIDAISSVPRIKNVIVFIQRKRGKSKESLLFNYNPSYPNNLENSYRKKRRFIEAFQDKGIKCTYVIYPRFNVTPPFHGRYWLSNTGGFIVDGSLNTAENKTVLVQVMDYENFELIKNMTRTITDFTNPNLEFFDISRLEQAFFRLRQNRRY